MRIRLRRLRIRLEEGSDTVKIVDAHHHLWDLKANHYPWLHDPKTPRLYGDHAPICRDYVLTDYLADIGGLEIVKSVHVQADHDFAEPVRETRWLQSIADKADNPRGFPHAIVAFADLAGDNAAEILEAHCQSPNMRGIRQALNGIVTNPARHPDILNDDRWRANVGLLGRSGLSFDLQVLPVQMASAAQLIDRFPELPFVLLHVGLPMDQSADGLRHWRGGLRNLAERPNLDVKISGFGMFDRKWTTESIRPLVMTTIETFGARRVMFGSNFPVDGMMASFDRVWQAYIEITSAFSDDEKRMMFADNACRFYRI